MNKADSQRISRILEDLSMNETDDWKKADFIIINTCSVRQSAEDRAFGFMHKFEMHREKNKPNLILAITGCMPGRDLKNKLKKKLPMVDLYFKIDEVVNLSKWLHEINPEIPCIDKPDYPLDYLNVKPKFKNNYQMFLPIQTGCNRFCTYCVVPYARGLERNRPFSDIMREAKSFVEKGGKEITLLGQTVNSYKFPEGENPKLSKDNPYKESFSALLYELNQLQGLERIFYTAPHPDDMSDECIDALALEKVINFLHIPVQSGSDKILKLMKRSYTRKQFIEVIKKVRKRVPNIAIGTDIIVGFCDESEEDFKETVSLYKEIEFDISYTAKYSTRSWTFAAKNMEDNVAYQEKQRRWRVLQELMEEITFKKNQQYKNVVVSVLFDDFEKGIASGWSSEMKRVQVNSTEDLSGKILDTKILIPKTWILEGELN